MKKLFLGSIVLTLFSISLLLFQLSCQEEVNANPTNTQLNKIIYHVFDNQSQKHTIYTANHDGTNKTPINIVIPGAANPSFNTPRLSPDGLKVFFKASSGNTQAIYSCNLDGSNLKVVLDGNFEFELGEVY